MQRFLENLELILTGAGVLVIAGAFAVFRNLAPWKAAAICAVAVGVLHGIIFYAVRTAQRRIRHRAIRSIRYRMQDAVAEKIGLLTASSGDEQAVLATRYALDDVERSLAIIEAEALVSRELE